MHRGSLANNDWIQLNGPFNLFQIDSVDVPLRGQRGHGRTGRLAAGARSRSGTGSQTGPIVTTRT